MLVTNPDFSHCEIRLQYRELKSKIVTLLAVAALGGVLAGAFGQEATDAGLQSSPAKQKGPEQKARPVATPEPTIPELSQIDDIFQQSSLGKEADEMRLRVQWRTLANRVANDPQVVAAKKSANNAPTDLEKRERLRVYYDIYYGKMRALASSDQLKSYLDQMKQQHISLLNQARVRPSADITPTPFPAHKRRKK
jgi:hypothetical protein